MVTLSLQGLSKIFETSTLSETLRHFLCYEDMAALKEDWDTPKTCTATETPAEEDPLLAWWENLTKSGNLAKGGSADFPCGDSEERAMSTDDYKKLVSM